MLISVRYIYGSWSVSCAIYLCAHRYPVSILHILESYSRTCAYWMVGPLIYVNFIWGIGNFEICAKEFSSTANCRMTNTLRLRILALSERSVSWYAAKMNTSARSEGALIYIIRNQLVNVCSYFRSRLGRISSSVLLENSSARLRRSDQASCCSSSAASGLSAPL